MGERGHRWDEGRLMVGRRLQRAGDRVGGSVNVMFVLVTAPSHSAPDVATSGPAP